LHFGSCPRNPVFSAVKANGMLVAGGEGAAIHPSAAAREGEPIVVKHRDSPFVGTDLETLLRANGIDTLVLAGVHTSGVVLSTVCQAVDLDYRLVVVRDCCADPDAEAHAMLLDIVIAKQAAVVTMADFAGAQPGRSSSTNASDSVATPSPMPLLGALILALCVRFIRRECRSLAEAGFEFAAFRYDPIIPAFPIARII
jgi:hypothetical protein